MVRGGTPLLDWKFSMSMQREVMPMMDFLSLFCRELSKLFWCLLRLKSQRGLPLQRFRKHEKSLPGAVASILGRLI